MAEAPRGFARGVLATAAIIGAFMGCGLLAAVVSGCTNEEATVKAAKASGLKDVRPTGYAWFACSERDYFNTAFTATGADGEPVSGAVCCGLWLRNCTLRFDR